MNLKVNRQIFLEEIVKANKIVDPKTINPELLGVLITVEEQKIIILSTNGSMNWKAVLTAKKDPQLEIKETGKILVKGRYLIDLLRKMEDEVVNLNVVETNELIITGKSLKFNLQILDPNNFPLIGFREQGNKINLDPKELKKAIAQVIISVDENNKKILLTGMNLKGSKNQKFLEIYTTDSFRISRRLIQLDQELKMNVDINIPFKTLTEILRLADSTTSMMAIIFSGYLTLVFDGYALLQTNLIEGKFPNVERAFPNDFATRIILNRAKIIRSINRANIGNEENVAQSVTLDIKNDIIKLSSQSIDVGNYDEDFRDFKLTGTEQLISFNTKFLLEALKSFDTEEIELNLISPTKPLEIQTLDDESLKQLILPLSIN